MTQVRKSPNTVQNVVTYDVVIGVDNSDLALVPGMTASTQIVMDSRANVLRVPDQALRYTPGGLSAVAAVNAPPANGRSHYGGERLARQSSSEFAAAALLKRWSWTKTCQCRHIQSSGSKT